MREKEITYEYIRGLIDGEGCFTFCSVPSKERLPTFVLGMSNRDKKLIEKVRDKLGLKSEINCYKPRMRKDGYNRMGMCTLMVRDVGQLKNKIVPLFYKNLVGYKADQFEEWIEKIESDPLVPERYKFIHKIYKAGFYDKNPKDEE